MDPASKREVAVDVFPYLREYKDGTVERTAGTLVVPAGFDPEAGVESKDIVIIPETGVSARLYRRRILPANKSGENKLPLVLYFHGGAFCISSVADPLYHNSLNILVAEANIIAVSVDYRRAPEHPLPAAYEDAWAALQWVASQVDDRCRDGHEPWIKDQVDFGKVFLVGDSAGATMAHHVALRAAGNVVKLLGIGLINPYFWGEKAIGSEITDPVRKAMVDNWWRYVCPSEKGGDDPLINPFVEGSPSLSNLACHNILVTIAEKDILRDRGRLYYEKLVNSGWTGKAEIVETQGEDHVFHIFDPNCEKAKSLIKRLSSFINQRHL